MDLDDLRAARWSARRDLELAGMRMKRDAVELEPLRERVRVLTDDLIARYAADLTLVDRLLRTDIGAAAPADGALAGRRTR